MLKDSLRAQQKPCADRVQSFKCSAVDLDIGGTFGIQTAQYGIKTASLADDPRPADDQAQSVATALQAVPCSCPGGGSARCAGSRSGSGHRGGRRPLDASQSKPTFARNHGQFRGNSLGAAASARIADKRECARSATAPCGGAWPRPGPHEPGKQWRASASRDAGRAPSTIIRRGRRPTLCANHSNCEICPGLFGQCAEKLVLREAVGRFADRAQLVALPDRYNLGLG